MRALLLASAFALIATTAEAGRSLNCHPYNGPKPGVLLHGVKIVVGTGQCSSGKLVLIGGNNSAGIARTCHCAGGGHAHYRPAKALVAKVPKYKRESTPEVWVKPAEPVARIKVPYTYTPPVRHQQQHPATSPSK